MKTYRQREKQGSKVQESTKGPDEAKIKALLERTSYTLDVTTGQRKYGGPPPDTVYSGSQPGIGTEASSAAHVGPDQSAPVATAMDSEVDPVFVEPVVTQHHVPCPPLFLNAVKKQWTSPGTFPLPGGNDKKLFSVASDLAEVLDVPTVDEPVSPFSPTTISGDMSEALKTEERRDSVRDLVLKVCRDRTLSPSGLSWLLGKMISCIEIVSWARLHSRTLQWFLLPYQKQGTSISNREVFVGKIPRDLYEDELVPLFEKAGPIWDLRLMMDPLSGQNRGYAFITFCSKDAAQEAVKLCDNYEIRPGKHLGVCISVANNRLFVGSIPKNKTKENILEEFSKVTEGLVDVILYHQPDDKKKNRGFCFLEYEDHKSAAQARRRLMSGKVKVWGNVVTVEWADPVEEPDPEVMAKVKVLFVRNLATTVTEEILEKSFSEFGKLERVKKLKDYAFVHFEDRGAAVKAMNEMNGKEIEGEEIEIVLAKPPDKKRKERQAARQASRSTAYEDYYYYPPPRMPPPIRGRGRGGRGGYGYPPDYYGYEDYYDDYYGYDYHDYRGGYEDPYYGYDDGYTIRGRGGGRGGRGAPPPPRGRGAPPPRGRAGYSQRGAPMGPPRGARGGRGGPAQQQRGRGARGARGNRGGNVGGKRKADGYNQPDSKRRQTNNQQNWGSQPIAQQPLQQGGDYAGNYGYNNDNQEFYQDTYGQQWK
ncbi:heterogeneous nuclear ribonucleoprotein R isoform X1 [Crotalus tigris]|nr:heterogeneous nuclear ribonucleoprotein R isoform X1 [Crotalus tigris]